MSKEFWKSKLFWTGVFMIVNAGIDAYLDGGGMQAIVGACFGMLVIVFRKYTTQGMAFALKLPPAKGKDIFSDIDTLPPIGDEETTGKVQIVPNGDKPGPN